MFNLKHYKNSEYKDKKFKDMSNEEKQQFKKNLLRDILIGFLIFLVCFIMAINYEFNKKCITQNGVTKCYKNR